jgi:hypothetical protein
VGRHLVGGDLTQVQECASFAMPSPEIRLVCGNDSIESVLQKNKREDAAKQAITSSIAAVLPNLSHLM